MGAGEALWGLRCQALTFSQRQLPRLSRLSLSPSLPSTRSSTCTAAVIHDDSTRSLTSHLPPPTALRPQHLSSHLPPSAPALPTPPTSSSLAALLADRHGAFHRIQQSAATPHTHCSALAPTLPPPLPSLSPLSASPFSEHQLSPR